jgi:hypothetical protein
MYEFESIDLKQLEALETSWNILEKITDSESLPRYYILGILELKYNKEVGEIYKEHLADYLDEGEEIADPDVKSVAVSIQVSSDQLFYLLNGGLLLDREEIAIEIGDKVTQVELHLRSLGKIRAMDLGKLSISTDYEAVEELLSGSKTASKKADAQSSRIVNILDEPGSDWNDQDQASNARMMEKIQDSNKNNQYVSYTEGELSHFLIEVKNGPEAAIRYIAAKLDVDYDEIASDAVTLSWSELESMMHEIMNDRPSMS